MRRCATAQMLAAFCTLAVPLLLSQAAAAAETKTTASPPVPETIYTFEGGKTGGLIPTKLIQDAKGNLYGSTYLGGSFNEGMLFKLTPPVTGKGLYKRTILHSFGGTLSNKTKDGAASGILVKDNAGNFYGMTTSAIFRYSPSTGQYSIIYRNSVKSNLIGNLVVDYEKKVLRLIFQIIPQTSLPSQLISLQFSGSAWKPTIVYAFPNKGPYASALTTDSDGNIFFVKAYENAITQQLIKLTPPASGKTSWTPSTLLTFPTNGFIFDQSGNLVVTSTGDIYGLDQGTQSLWQAAPNAAKTRYTFSEPASFQSIRTEGVWSLIPGQTGELFAQVGFNGDSAGGIERLDPPASGHKTWKVSTAIASTPNIHWVPSFAAAGVMYGVTDNNSATKNDTVFKLTSPPQPQ
jgi:uncharacterized repeat protein (TIGR03803 family)